MIDVVMWLLKHLVLRALYIYIYIYIYGHLVVMCLKFLCGNPFLDQLAR
jgi:hypothetical protein